MGKTEMITKDSESLGITTNKLSLDDFDASKVNLPETVMPKRKPSQGFIRQKIIHGRPYWYLVKSIREGGKVKQNIIKYLGSRKARSK